VSIILLLLLGKFAGLRKKNVLVAVRNNSNSIDFPLNSSRQRALILGG
jgi:hypothetical protein